MGDKTRQLDEVSKQRQCIGGRDEYRCTVGITETHIYPPLPQLEYRRRETTEITPRHQFWGALENGDKKCSTLEDSCGRHFLMMGKIEYLTNSI